MRKFILVFAGLCFAFAGHAALDATLLKSELMLRGAPASTRTELAIIAPVAYTTNAATTVVKAIGEYYGKGELVIAASGNADPAYTNIFTVVSGTNATLTGTTTTLATYTHAANDTSVKALEIDFDAVTGTHWGVLQVGETGNDSNYAFSVTLYHDAIGTAAISVTGDAVDTMPYQGTAAIVVEYGAVKKGADGFSGTVQIQSATARDGSYTNVTGLSTTFTNTAGGSAVIPYDTTGGKRYLKAVYTTTNDVTDISVWINGYK